MNIRLAASALVLLLSVSNCALAARDSYLYISQPSVFGGGNRQAVQLQFAGDATGNSQITNTLLGTNFTISEGAEAGLGRAVFNFTNNAGTVKDSYKADATQVGVDGLTKFATGHPYSVTGSAGADGAHVGFNDPGFFFNGKVNHVDTTGAISTDTAQPFSIAGAVGDAGGLYHTTGGNPGLWYHSVGNGIHEKLVTGNTTNAIASTESGALYNLATGGTDYVDELGNAINVSPSPLGKSAVVGGGALVDVGGFTQFWSDSSKSLTILDASPLSAAVTLGDDALYQTSNGFFYYDSSTGTSTLQSSVTEKLIGGVSAGDFAMVTIESTVAPTRTYIYKDAGGGAKERWTYFTTALPFDYDGAVGGYLEVATITPGDFNEDGGVDGRDFLVWQRDTNVGNLADWQTNYGGANAAAAATAGTSAVPEPSSGLLLAIAVCGLLGRRRAKIVER